MDSEAKPVSWVGASELSEAKWGGCRWVRCKTTWPDASPQLVPNWPARVWIFSASRTSHLASKIGVFYQIVPFSCGQVALKESHILVLDGFGPFFLGLCFESPWIFHQTSSRRPVSLRRHRIIFAVETAAGKSTRQQMARSIRESFWSIFKYPNNDVHVLISQGEMAFAKAAEGGVARFKIRHGGQDLFVTLLKRSGKPVNFGAPINFGHGTMSDLDILRRFGKGLYDLQNIFRLQSVEWIYKQTQEVFSKGLSPDKMAQRLESLVQQKWGGGWNVIVSPNKITAGVNQNDVKAAFKARDIFQALQFMPPVAAKKRGVPHSSLSNCSKDICGQG